jgi:hypothetical protein
MSLAFLLKHFIFDIRIGYRTIRFWQNIQFRCDGKTSKEFLPLN